MKTAAIEYAIRLLEGKGYRINPPFTEESILNTQKHMAEFEESARQFPDELFLPKKDLVMKILPPYQPVKEEVIYGPNPGVKGYIPCPKNNKRIKYRK